MIFCSFKKCTYKQDLFYQLTKEKSYTIKMFLFSSKIDRYSREEFFFTLSIRINSSKLDETWRWMKYRNRRRSKTIKKRFDNCKSHWIGYGAFLLSSNFSSRQPNNIESHCGPFTRLPFSRLFDCSLDDQTNFSKKEHKKLLFEPTGRWLPMKEVGSIVR